MKKMLVALLALALCGYMASGVLADTGGAYKTPRDQKGDAAHPYYGGYKSTTINYGTETIVCSGRCLLAELYFSTGLPTQGVIIRDTSVANASGKEMFPRWRFSQGDSDTQRPKLSRPSRTSNGLSVTLVGATATESITVLYLDNQ